MGFFDKAKSVAKTAGTVGAVVTGASLLNNHPNVAKVIGATAAVGLITGLLKPPPPCPPNADGGDSNSGGVDDPCGTNDNSTKNLLLGMAANLATPYLNEINKNASKGLADIGSTLGKATSAGISKLGGAMGLDPHGAGQEFLNTTTKCATAIAGHDLKKNLSDTISKNTNSYINPKVGKSEFDDLISKINSKI
jgi:hypothetical protein